MGFCSFHHYWLKAKEAGLDKSFWDFDLNYLACQQGKFNKINTQNPLYDMPYAYHFDSALYGQFLRRFAEQGGVKRTEGIIEHVQQNAKSGFVTGLQLTDGRQIEGDLFIDCTGLRGLLIRQTLGVNYEDWSHWLPADSAQAVPSERFDKTLPYTRSIAHDCGWQWRIPLTHRNGNGMVYSSRFTTDEQSTDTLMSNLDSKALDEPRTIRFHTGRTEQQWCKNVVAIGLASGFLEPLESTSIHLIQSGIIRLMKMFPNQGISAAMIDMYNAESQDEYETIRDFIILHYHVNERDDSEFWRAMREMTIPDRLAQKIAAFKETAAIFNEQNDMFRDASWVQVMMGQGLSPVDYHGAVNAMDKQTLLSAMQQIHQAKQQPVSKLLGHDEFIQRYTSA